MCAEATKDNYSLLSASASWTALSGTAKQQWAQKEVVKTVSPDTIFRQRNDAVKKMGMSLRSFGTTAWLRVQAAAAQSTDNMHVVAFAWLRKENGFVIHHVHHSNTKFALHFLDTIGQAAADTTLHVKNFTVSSPSSSTSSISQKTETEPEAEPKSTRFRGDTLSFDFSHSRSLRGVRRPLQQPWEEIAMCTTQSQRALIVDLLSS